MALHRIGVNLTHVPTPVGLSNFFNVQVPRFVFAMGYAYPTVFRYNVIVNCQDCLCVDSQPSHLKQILTLKMKFEIKVIEMNSVKCIKSNIYIYFQIITPHVAKLVILQKKCVLTNQFYINRFYMSNTIYLVVSFASLMLMIFYSALHIVVLWY